MVRLAVIITCRMFTHVRGRLEIRDNATSTLYTETTYCRLTDAKKHFPFSLTHFRLMVNKQRGRFFGGSWRPHSGEANLGSGVPSVATVHDYKNTGNKIVFER